MAFDLNSSYLRKDGASASNVYYGYALHQKVGDSEFAWSIRKVNTNAGVETSTWANNSTGAFYSCWNDRAACFTAPSGSLGLTWSISGTSSTGYNVSLSWSGLTGVEKYVLATRDVNGKLLTEFGTPFVGAHTHERSYTEFVINKNRFVQKLQSGTYSITLSGVNIAGTMSATASLGLQ